MSDWKSRAVAVNPNSDWKSRAELVKETPEDSGALIAGTRAGISQATGGFSDELLGLTEGAGRALGVEGLGTGKHLSDLHLSDDGPTLDWETLKHAYNRARNQERDALKRDSDEHSIATKVGGLAGAVASPLNKLTSGMKMAEGGAVLGGINGLGNSDSEDVAGMVQDAGAGAALGGTAGHFAGKAAPYISKMASAVGQKLGSVAEGLAVNATGATGKQASEFADDAGRQLLDRGLVKFGDNSKNVATRTEGALTSANAAIDDSLKALDAKGVTANVDNITAELEKKIASLEGDPSQAGTVRKLKTVLEDIYNTGQSNVKISAGEQTKRGFNKMAGNWMDPEAGQAGKQAYQSYMGEVENAANSADPQLAQKFMEGKDTHGLLAPIQEAAERRARTVNQSPIGGLGDMVAAGAGAASGGPIMAGASVAGKKLIAPRISSSLAVTADTISKSLMKNPEMANLATSNPQAFQSLVNKLEQRSGVFQNPASESLPKAADKPDDTSMNFNDSHDKQALVQKTQGTKYQQVLANAAQKGDAAFGAAYYVLHQRDPGFRSIVDN